MTKMVVAYEFGDPRQYVLEQAVLAPPGPFQVRVAVRAIGVSYFDVLVAAGRYQMKPPLPFVPGSECAGEVEAIGAQVTHIRVGDRVVVAHIGGVMSEKANFPESAVRQIPHDMPFDHAAVLVFSYGTAYHALVQRAALQPFESLLVLGAGGATGYAAVQTGKALGARVIASASTPEKRTLATRGGADIVIDSQSSHWRDDVRSAAASGVDVVFDPLGGKATEPAFRSLRWKGRHLVVGFAAGEIPKLSTNLALLKGAALMGVDFRQFGLFEPFAAEQNIDAIFDLYSAGRLVPPITRIYPIEAFAEAMVEVGQGGDAGRTIIVVP